MLNRLRTFVVSMQKILSSKACVLILLAFNYLFTFLSILHPTVIMGVIFLLINGIVLLFAKNKIGIQIIFSLYPLSRVLKIPGLSTSLLTLLLLFYVVLLIVKSFISYKERININKIIFLFLFIIYCILTLLVSLINYGSFSITRLLSYYLYLSFPVVIAFAFIKRDDIDGVTNLLIFSLSFLIGMIYTICFHYLIPNGSEMLSNAGVTIYDMKSYGIRFSPLTDDPNYGTAAIILISSLFLSAKKTKKQIIVGVPIMLINMVLSALSLSKMFFLCALIMLAFWLLTLVIQNKSITLAITSVFGIALFSLLFLSTPIGNTLLIRTIGTTDGISMNRITSGRTELFGEYSSYILSNPLVVLFGKGPLYSNKALFSNGEHNTFTINILGSGIIGVTIMLLVLFLIGKERFDKERKMPKNANFIGFLICMMICCMSLSISPSTVFPVIVAAAQFISFETKKGQENKKKDLADSLLALELIV